MCVRCQLDVSVRLTYCARRFLLSDFPLGFLRFTDRILDDARETIHTEHGATFAASRYKSACKGTTFCKSGNHFPRFF